MKHTDDLEWVLSLKENGIDENELEKEKEGSPTFVLWSSELNGHFGMPGKLKSKITLPIFNTSISIF